MPTSSDEHIGTRVRIARNAAGLTQVEMADFLGRAESWVANVESGRQPLDRYSVITSIAELCDVDVVWLLGQPYRLERGGGLAHAHVPALRTGLRRSGLILTGHPGLAPQGAPVDLAMLMRQTSEAAAARQAANLLQVAKLLPPLIEDLNTAVLTAAGAAKDQALRLLASAARTARMALNQFGYPDLAWSAAEVAAGAAAILDDPVEKAAVAWDRCGALLHQASLRETIAVADAALHDLEPHVTGRQVNKEALSLRGALHLRCSIAHARGVGSPDDAWSRLGLALEDSDRLGRSWYDLDRHTVFGRGTVAVHAAEIGVEVDQPGDGLARVPEVNIAEVPSKERRTHFRIDEARALHRMGQSSSAVVKLRQAAADAPYYVYADPMSRALVSDLSRVGVPTQAAALSGLIRNMELVR
ncbi:helix-turn-helix domain-containing protein [Streptomyces sp. NPDC088745]|uniref:helix-turn-helix domain-containing protein n=1 Tax=Streptomyces sp. NPDC088745 TaxID=3365884 RepID=UPI0038023DAF